MREMARLCLVVPAAVALTKNRLRTVRSPLMRAFAPNRELEPEAGELDDAHRRARMIRRHARLLPAALPVPLRGAIRRVTPEGRLPVWMQMHPWQRIVDTGRVDSDGLPVLAMQQLGILIDVVWRPEDVEIAAIEAHFLARLVKRSGLTGKGRRIDMWEDTAGLRLIPRSAITSPAIVRPVWAPPPIVKDPQLAPGP